MRLSHVFTKTSKEAASDTASRNAELLTKAGFIDKTMAGVYAYLPLGIRVLQNIERILREEMDRIGNEVLLPSICPTTLWEQTGRLDSVNVLFQASPANDASKQHNDARYVLNSTHEEVITPLVQRFVKSYKDLPCAAYQIQTKFRNEARAKSGIMRGREFRMKDLYSFHRSEEDMLEYFLNTAIPAYQRFFSRVGLGEKTVIALASGGDFSKEPSREFQTRCDNGEDHIFHAPGSEIFYNRELAPSMAKAWTNANEELRPLENVTGKGMIGVKQLCEFLNIEIERTTKTMLFAADDNIVAAAVRGDYDVNEIKLREVLGCKTLQLASAETVKRITKAEVGYAGPLNLPANVRIVWDESCKDRRNFECGANRTDEHTINVNFGRDLPVPDAFYDIKTARDGDSDPHTGKPYEVFRASEVGNVFTLFTKFSDAFNFTFIDEDGKAKPVYMGCYGIGTSRVMGVIAEVCSDESGLRWPAAVAPAQYHIVALAKTRDDEAFHKATELYELLTKKSISCVFDDRIDQSTGSRLADADLIGIPQRLLISSKSLSAGGVEQKDRWTGETSIVAWKDVTEYAS